MDGHAVRGKLLDLPQRIFHIRCRLSRKPRDQIHIDIVKPKLPCCIKSFLHFIHGVPPPDSVESLLLHRLGIYGNPGNPMAPDHFQLFFRYAVRPSCLHRILQKILPGKMLFNAGQKLFKLRSAQGCGSTAAYIDGIELFSCGFLRNRL